MELHLDFRWHGAMEKLNIERKHKGIMQWQILEKHNVMLNDSSFVLIDNKNSNGSPTWQNNWNEGIRQV